MIVFDDHLALLDRRLGKGGVDIVDRRRRHVGGAQPRKPVGGRSGAEDLLEHRHQHLAVLDPARIVVKARIAGEIWMLKHGAQFAPEDFLPGGDDDIAVRGREGLPRNRIVVRRAGRLRHLTVGQPHGADIVQQMQHGVEHRHLDAAPFAGPFAVKQRGQYPLARVNPAAHIGERNADAHRRTPGLAGDGHVAADRLDVEVERRIDPCIRRRCRSR